MKTFDFEKLDVFQATLEFADLTDQLAERMPPGRAYLADQLRRAANSIMNNTAEGAGEFSPLEKARFYRIALRSATETAAMLVFCRRRSLFDDLTLEPANDTLHRIVSMLTKLTRNVASRRAEAAAAA